MTRINICVHTVAPVGEGMIPYLLIYLHTASGWRW